MKGTRPPISHLFQVQLAEAKLTKEQATRVATAIREATAKELLKMDFRIEELKKTLFDPNISSNCGGGCHH